MISFDTARTEVAGVTGSTPFDAEFEALFSDLGEAALRRDAAEAHVTASCLIFDPDTESVLLNHHRKAQLWGQFGGHLEAEDETLASAARREALEESGLGRLAWLSPRPIDLHVHDLSAAFGSCRRHFDVVFAAVASVSDSPTVSSESIDVRWFGLGELPDALMPDLPTRLPGLYRAGTEALRLTSFG